MILKKLTEDIFTVGSIDWDRRLFDELIPLPEGTTYNAYIVKGKNKTVLIDTVDPTKTKELLSNIKRMGVEKIDYIIANHAEQDHSGSIAEILKKYPGSKVLTNRKCADMLKDHLLLNEDDFEIISDGQKFDIGGKTFEFILTPWTHWPETMVSYLYEDEILFSCDLFGSHYSTSDLYAINEREVYLSAKRYYAEIMMPFRQHIQKYLEKFSKYKIRMIAPSHGPVYNKPEFIIDAYKDWTSDKVKKEVIIPYVSMHDSTKVMVEYLIDRLIEKDITVKPFNLTKTDIGELAMELVDAAVLVVGSPTVLGGPHPNAVYAVYLTNLLRPKLRYFSFIGSYGWGGKMVDMVKSMVSNLKVEMIEPVIAKGYPKKEDFEKLDILVEKISEAVCKI